jgi:threonine/homoserine/homoserine lactone efflux protein
MTPASLLALSTVVLVAALTPGPAVTAIVARAITDGLRPALAIGAGVVTGDVLFLLLAAAGVSAAARSLGAVFAVLQVLGAAYLCWQGIRYWRAHPRVPPAAVPAGMAHERRLWRNYAAGLLLMFGHVQAMLFYAALLPGFVDPGALSVADIAVLVAMLVVVFGGVNAAYAVLAARARGFFADERAQRALHRVAGTLMFAAAALVASR